MLLSSAAKRRHLVSSLRTSARPTAAKKMATAFRPLVETFQEVAETMANAFRPLVDGFAAIGESLEDDAGSAHPS